MGTRPRAWARPTRTRVYTTHKVRHIPIDWEAIEKERKHWWPFMRPSGFGLVISPYEDPAGRTKFYETSKRQIGPPHF